MTTPEEPEPAEPDDGAAEEEKPEPSESDRPAGVGDVAGDLGSAIFGAKGPVNSGSGPQLNTSGNGHQYYIGETASERRTLHLGVTGHRVGWLRHRFVEPGNYHEATRGLAESAGIVLLAGPPGCGRRTAAQMLLCPDPDLECSITLVPVELDQGDEGYRPFDGDDVDTGDRLLLDLSETDRRAFRKHQDRLHVLQPAVDKKMAKLVVILPAHHETLRDDFASLRVTISRPDGIAVIDKHLRAAKLEVDTAVLEDQRRRLLSLSMAEIEQVVARVVEVSKSAPDGGLADWLAEALNGRAQREAHIQDLLSSKPQAPPRVLLLTAAMLENAPVECVFRAHRDLLGILEFQPSEERTGIEFETVDQALVDMTAKHELSPSRRLAFADPELGATLLTYYWDQFPWLRQDLAAWVRELVIGGSLGQSDQRQVAIRFAEQCIRSREAELALDIAEAWIKGGNHLARLTAYTFLYLLLADERTGASARQRIYWLSRDPKLVPQVAAIVIALCVEVISQQYLDQAVVRLAWLAQHENSTIRQDARSGLVELAAGDAAVLSRVFELLLERSRFDVSTFAIVSVPGDGKAVRLVAADAALRGQLQRGWHRLLESVDHQDRGFALMMWLETHADLLTAADDASAELLIRQLMEICSQRVQLNALFNASRDWFGLASESSDIRRRRRTSQVVEAEIRRARRQLRAEVRRQGHVEK